VVASLVATGRELASPACPSCGRALEPADYEGMRPLVCRGCGGRLVSGETVKRILARREMGFTPEQEHLADVLAATGDRLRRAAYLARGKPGVTLLPCPGCGRQMVRAHFSYQHAVEVDRCFICDLVWFEKDELEALQILSERESG